MAERYCTICEKGGRFKSFRSAYIGDINRHVAIHHCNNVYSTVNCNGCKGKFYDHLHFFEHLTDSRDCNFNQQEVAEMSEANRKMFQALVDQMMRPIEEKKKVIQVVDLCDDDDANADIQVVSQVIYQSSTTAVTAKPKIKDLMVTSTPNASKDCLVTKVSDVGGMAMENLDKETNEEQAEPIGMEIDKETDEDKEQETTPAPMEISIGKKSGDEEETGGVVQEESGNEVQGIIQDDGDDVSTQKPIPPEIEPQPVNVALQESVPPREQLVAERPFGKETEMVDMQSEKETAAASGGVNGSSSSNPRMSPQKILDTCRCCKELKNGVEKVKMNEEQKQEHAVRHFKLIPWYAHLTDQQIRSHSKFPRQMKLCFTAGFYETVMRQMPRGGGVLRLLRSGGQRP